MIRIFLKIIVFVSLLAMVGCQADRVELEDNSNGLISAKLAVTRGTETNADALNHISAYRFYDGILEEVFSNLQSNGQNIINIKPVEMRGNVYFMINAENVLPGLRLENGVTTEEQFLSLRAETADMMKNGFLMTGMTTITRQTSAVEIALKRSLARIDIKSPMQGIEVNSVKLKKVCTSGYVLDGGAGGSVDAETVDLIKDYGMNPLSVSEENLFYVPQQEGKDFEVEIMVTLAGAWHRLKTVLPEISRNKVYTLNVYAEGSALRVEVNDGNWVEGNGSASEELVNALVDIDNSSLEDGVKISEGRDTVFIPSWETNCSIALVGETGSTAKINGNVLGADVVLVESAGRLSNINISSRHKMPGTKDEYLYVDVHNGDVLRGRVVLVFKANPVYLEGLIKINDQGICDFEDYVDGELAEIHLPEGKAISLEFDGDTPEWMKLEETAAGVYRLLGGWRPNDPEADGRVQEGKIVISEVGGIHPESYTIKRRNWGLPVVNINGTWWCKYNLRGNVKSFSDQILVKNDPAEGGSIAEYLKTCTDDEFLNILGGQYQAGNQNELKMIYSETGFVYEGYSQKTDNFGTLDPKFMAPKGYELPDYDDYRFFNWGGNSNLAYNNPGVFNNGLGQRLNYIVVERDATFLGYQYGPVMFYDFEFGGEHLTLCGLGHQWDSSNIAKMNVLLATYGNGGSTWGIEGYSKADGRGNWFKFSANNPQKTRTIRCIKSPVEYIY